MSETTLEHKNAVKNGVGRMVLAVLSICIQFLVLFLVFMYFTQKAGWIVLLMGLVGLFLVLNIYAQHKTASIKMVWIMLIMAMPIVGIIMYLLVGNNYHTRSMKKRYQDMDDILFPLLPGDADVREQENERDRRFGNISRYLSEIAGFPAYSDSRITYYDDARKGLDAQLEELKKAEHFIFMEYHAIEDAESWGLVADVLAQRVKAGVEVRVIYDDMGSIGFINTDFINRMESLGIACRVFNPFVPWINIFLDNRDHRKITVIDGRIGFTGGYNMANEYFHVTEPFGYWKDTGVKIEGNAVRSLTMMFLEMWNAMKAKDSHPRDTDFQKYMPQISTENPEGFIQPYGDSPLDDNATGEDVYSCMVEAAQDYVWFVTPYLIITEETAHILSMAAKRGVDVRIITPGIPDKKIIYSVTRSY
nr:PLDc N-terminal domain-containing protein [Lachnospiraceae bacterium]